MDFNFHVDFFVGFQCAVNSGIITKGIDDLAYFN